MLKNARLFVLLIGVILISILVSSAGLAAGGRNCGWPQQDPVAIANQFLDRLQAGYQTANLPLIISLYNDPMVMVDVSRDINLLYTAESMKAEIEMAFLGLSGIKCQFLDRQITSEDDTIMIRALRTISANEIPITVNCVVLMVLKRPFTHRQPWNYVVTDQILLKEEYLPKSDVSILQNNTDHTGQQTPSLKKYRRFMF